MKKQYKIFLYIGFPTLLLAGAGVASWYFFFNKKEIKEDNNKENNNKEDDKENDKNEVTNPNDKIPEEDIDIKKIFPSIAPNYYYDLLEYKENDINISETIVVKIIKDVISRIGINFDKVGYKIIENKKHRKEIKFIVLKKEKTYTKTYTFFINVL
ncbi:MAG: MHO_1590 family protein [Metamycoplasmataceae bacterium]